jgi:hypothetical protein
VTDVDYLKRLILARVPEICEADLDALAGVDQAVLTEIAEAVDAVVEAVQERMDAIEDRLADLQPARAAQ